MYRHFPEYNKDKVPIARLLRKNMTNAERTLWLLLRNNKIGVKFRRQVPFGKYILDFYCAKAKLDIELDGSQHYTDRGRRDDIKRDQNLQRLGIKVLRFSDREFLQNQDIVLQLIFDIVQKRLGKETSS